MTRPWATPAAYRGVKRLRTPNSASTGNHPGSLCVAHAFKCPAADAGHVGLAVAVSIQARAEDGPINARAGSPKAIVPHCPQTAAAPAHRRGESECIHVGRHAYGRAPGVRVYGAERPYHCRF